MSYKNFQIELANHIIENPKDLVKEGPTGGSIIRFDGEGHSIEELDETWDIIRDWRMTEEEAPKAEDNENFITRCKLAEHALRNRLLEMRNPGAVRLIVSCLDDYEALGLE